jgi:hypothetical protein
LGVADRFSVLSVAELKGIGSVVDAHFARFEHAHALNNPTTLTDPLGLQPNDGDQCQQGSGGTIYCNVTAPGGPGDPLLNEIYEYDICGMGLECNYEPVSGGGGAPAPTPAPKPAPSGGPEPSYGQVLQSFNGCAANFADAHGEAALASGFFNIQNNFILNTAFGRTTAAASNLFFQSNPNLYVPAGGSLAAGAQAGTAIKLGSLGVGALPTGGTIYTYAGETVATQYGLALEMGPTSTTVADTAAGGALLSGANGLAGLLDLAAPALVGWDELMYGIGEAACAAPAF